MYLKIKNKKLKIIELNTFKKRFKSLKFNLNKLDYCLYFPNKKFISTDFFCQKVDICFTDKNNNILYLHSNVKSEKRMLYFKSKNIYILPLDTCNNLIIGDKLNIIEE